MDGDSATVTITLTEVATGWRLAWGNESLTIPRAKAEAIAQHSLLHARYLDFASIDRAIFAE